MASLLFAILDESVRLRGGALNVHRVILLGPLTGQDGGYSQELACIHTKVGKVEYIPFKNFLLAYFLKKASWETGR